jgi:arylsulfatase
MTQARRPNVIWLLPDQWRHDAFGAAGNTVVHTPNIDALARRGMIFRAAHCESPVCMPSRASLVSGTYPSEHGLLDNIPSPATSGGLSPTAPNFVRSLRDAGYRTAEIGKMHLATAGADGLAAIGFDDIAEEFDKFEYCLEQSGEHAYEDTPYTRHLAERGLLDDFLTYSRERAWWPRQRGTEPGPKATPDVIPADDTLDSFIMRSAAKYVREYERDEPFFLWVTPVGPHTPYDGPPPYSDLYDPARIPLGPLGFDSFPENEWGSYLDKTANDLGAPRWTQDDFRLVGKHYYASISLIDARVGELVAALEASGQDRETWIMISSDHGELLGDHGFYAKRLFYRSSVQVPQIVVPPAGTHIGSVFDGLTQGFDVPATILDLAGADPPSELCSGRSLLPAMESGGTGRDAVYSEIADFLMVATLEHKLIVDRPSRTPQALYDLQNDPDERFDILATRPGRDALNRLAPLANAFIERSRP